MKGTMEQQQEPGAVDPIDIIGEWYLDTPDDNNNDSFEPDVQDIADIVRSCIGEENSAHDGAAAR
jgi:hypothetical protein